MRPVLLGVTREAVVRIKPKNREVLQEWPLTKIKQWEVRANVFTLDFGEYGKQYSIQTQEGEQIARLLNGYVNILCRRKQKVRYPADHRREPLSSSLESIYPLHASFLRIGSWKHSIDSDSSDFSDFSKIPIDQNTMEEPMIRCRQTSISISTSFVETSHNSSTSEMSSIQNLISYLYNEVNFPFLLIMLIFLVLMYNYPSVLIYVTR